jgi:hypothetical protein
VLSFTIWTNPYAIANTYDANLAYLFQAICAKSKTTIATPGKPLDLLAHQTGMEGFY